MRSGFKQKLNESINVLISHADWYYNKNWVGGTADTAKYEVQLGFRVKTLWLCQTEKIRPVSLYFGTRTAAL